MFLSAVFAVFSIVLDPECRKNWKAWEGRLGVLVSNLRTTKVVGLYWVNVSESSGADSPGLSRINGR